MQQHSILCRQVGIVVSQMRVPYGTPLKSGFPTHNQSSAGGSQLYYNMISSCYYLSKEKRLQVEMKAFREVAIYNAAGSQQCHTILSSTYLYYSTSFSSQTSLGKLHTFHIQMVKEWEFGIPFWLNSQYGNWESRLSMQESRQCIFSSNFGTPHQNVQF